jgi:hypothetical protein
MYADDILIQNFLIKKKFDYAKIHKLLTKL